MLYVHMPAFLTSRHMYCNPSDLCKGIQWQIQLVTYVTVSSPREPYRGIQFPEADRPYISVHISRGNNGKSIEDDKIQ